MIILDNETYLVIKIISAIEHATHIPAIQFIAKLIPIVQAIPFPPLNFKRKG